MLKAPMCLHIPNLHEKKEALLSWETVEGATGYRLECVFDEDFESASHGLQWSNIHAHGKTWDEIMGLQMNWDDIRNLPAQGLSWNDVMFSGLSWNQIAEEDVTWKDVQTLPARFVIYDGAEKKIPGPDMGWTWEDVKSSEMSWENIKEAGVSWNDISFLPPKSTRGLSWDCLKARQYTWNDITERGLTFEEWKDQADARVHIAYTAEIPVGKKTAYYRVQAHDDAASSEHMTSPPITIIPVFYREDSLNFPVVKGHKYIVQLCMRGIHRFRDIGMIFAYTSPRLILNEFSYNTQHGQAKNRNMPLQFERGYDHGGTVMFKYHRGVTATTKLSTVVAEAVFTAADTGNALVKIY